MNYTTPELYLAVFWSPSPLLAAASLGKLMDLWPTPSLSLTDMSQSAASTFNTGQKPIFTMALSI